jgi:RHS repeat-associated protein
MNTGKYVRDYRFLFNGKESDSEWHSASGSIYDYGFRIYNPRIGKFLSVDPLTMEYPWNSTYAFAENDIIRSIDLEGLEKYLVIYDFSKKDITKTIIELETQGKLGNGYAIKSNKADKTKYYYSRIVQANNLEDFLEKSEGKKGTKDKYYTYKDTEGNPTAGIGHLVTNDETDYYTIDCYLTGEEAKELYYNDLKEHGDKAIRLLEKSNPTVSLNQHQKDAIKHLTFNTGPYLNYENFNADQGAESFILKYMKNESLWTRRYSEAIMYDFGSFVNTYSVSGNNNEYIRRAFDNANGQITKLKPRKAQKIER